MALEIGQEAPDFELKDSDNEPVRLASFRGERPVLVVFYPFTFSGICTDELCGVRDDYAAFEDKGVQVLAISCNARHAQGAWKEQQGYQFPVLTDFWPHGATAQAYDVFNDTLGCAYRYSFLVGTDGTIVDVFGTDEIGTPREHERYAEALAKL